MEIFQTKKTRITQKTAHIIEELNFNNLNNIYTGMKDSKEPF